MEFDYFCGMNNKEVFLVGAGGHALSLSEFAGNAISGYIAKEENPKMPGPWLGSDDALTHLLDRGIPFHIAFVYSRWPLMEQRRRIIEHYSKAGASFVSLIAPSAIVTPNSVIGEGSAIMEGAIVNRASLGRHVVVNSGAIIEHDCIVGDNTFIGPGAVIGGFTKLGHNCFIGLGARIGNGLTIGDNISIAMGAVVNRNLTEPGIYHGSPLRLHKSKNQ